MSTKYNNLSPDDVKPDFRVRLEVLFAARAPTAVVLRRGPKHHFQMIHWNTKTAKFTPGQWMKGRIDLFDLSPNGKYVIYRARQYHRSRFNHEENRPFDPLNDPFESAIKNLKAKHRSVPKYMRGGKKSPPLRANEGIWTAISKPPYFSALAIWPSHGTWTGGGFFRSDKGMVLFESKDGMTPQENTPIPANFKISRLGNWEKFLNLVKPSATRSAKSMVTQQFANALNKQGVQYFEWAMPDKSAAVIFACDGAIFRLRNWQDVTPQEYLKKATKLADFNTDYFTQTAPPRQALIWR